MSENSPNLSLSTERQHGPSGCSLHIETEHIRGEGWWHYVVCHTHRGYRRCDTLNNADVETAFVGRRAEQRAEKALAVLQGVG